MTFSYLFNFILIWLLLFNISIRLFVLIKWFTLLIFEIEMFMEDIVLVNLFFTDSLFEIVIVFIFKIWSLRVAHLNLLYLDFIILRITKLRLILNNMIEFLEINIFSGHIQGFSILLALFF